MKNIINSIRLKGEIATEPIFRNFPSGKRLVSFRFVTHESNQIGDEVISYSQWHSIVAWDAQADALAEKIQKGDEMTLYGNLKYRSYLKDEVKYQVAEINLTTFRKTKSEDLKTEIAA
jgi:single-stranded DNA-binding protein